MEANLVEELLLWTTRLDGQIWHPLFRLVDNPIVSLPLEFSRAALLKCADDPALLAMLARHLSDAGGYPDGSFAEFPPEISEKLLTQAESRNPQILRRLRNRLSLKSPDSGK